LLLGEVKTVNEALRQALELQAVFLAARPQKTCAKTFRGEPIATHPTKEGKAIGVLELWPLQE
jgi:hypothetical protein